MGCHRKGHTLSLPYKPAFCYLLHRLAHLLVFCSLFPVTSKTKRSSLTITRPSSRETAPPCTLYTLTLPWTRPTVISLASHPAPSPSPYRTCLAAAPFPPRCQRGSPCSQPRDCTCVARARSTDLHVLCSAELKWTSIDPVRFAEEEEEPGPLFLWVGVMPNTLSLEDARNPAVRCKEILLEYQINDIEIAFRESVFRQSTRAGPQLLNHVLFIDPTAEVIGPFTPTLGLQIASKAFPDSEGTGCLYLCEGGGRDRTFLLTARHVVLPPSEHPNEFYHHDNNSKPRLEVIRFGSGAFQNALEAIMRKIEHEHIMIDIYKEYLEGLGEPVEGEPARITADRKKFGAKLVEMEASKARVNEFHGHITKYWSAENERILGHVVYAPSISVGIGDKQFTQDWALIELNQAKFDWDAFQGNVVHLGTKLSPFELMDKLYPDVETCDKTDYPPGGLMQLRDFVKDGELCRPTMFGANAEECLIVVKNGAGTGVTFGRTTSIKAFVREYKGNVIQSTSMAIPIYSYTHKDGAFSGPGDSGAVIADSNGRIIGMLTGGAGKEDLIDVTYASPYYFLDEYIKKAFPNSYLYPFPN
ncbi:hypothetical protein BDN72DRAFT_760437 [Pluteus cervinus]|uniref:Uncharacterized protein n=1 Tax=Pluteus cervinus TaxID=181527 RepID=A0ACD3B8M6_9AGAR|nr:hypothetical protein BDN72DRAFT_760437 [Pluteus cervinus]